MDIKPFIPIIVQLVQIALSVLSNSSIIDALLQSDDLTEQQKKDIEEFRKLQLARMKDLQSKPTDPGAK